MSESVSVGSSTIITSCDVRFEGLKQKWRALKLCLSPDNEIFASEEWLALALVLEENPRNEEPAPTGGPKAIPGAFPSDPQSVVRAEIVKKFLNKRLWQAMIPAANGRPGDLVNLWIKPGTATKVGWRVWVRPNPSLSEGGYILVGDYNKYGDRLA
jgi:hypothetical protein